MNKVHVLDCTLRDGGYCNQWRFGFENTKKIVRGLIKAGIDIVECGFLTNDSIYDSNITKFNNLEQLSKVIPNSREGKLFVAMINYGEYMIEDLPEYDGTSIDGIRVAFHKNDLGGAIELCKKIKDKGYKVFVQAMVSTCYTDKEFLELINVTNQIMPYAFYIVDSFGSISGKNLKRLFYMAEHNLEKSIWIGFHSHNNIQLAYANAQAFVNVHTSRNLIVDSSIYGMGRGAGNLNTELFINYLNENYNKKYVLSPLLEIIDEILNYFYEKNHWGYSLSNYISAVHNAHPNYAFYLDDKKTLTIEDMDEIFNRIVENKKYYFDKEYIENVYLKYMAEGKVEEEKRKKIELQKEFKGKQILLIAPGKSSVDEKSVIINKSKNKNVVIVSVNYEYPHINVDYIFVSNRRRFRELDINSYSKCIATSNITDVDVFFQTEYEDLLCTEESVKDNAGIMAIKFFAGIGAEEIMLAGFDGYIHDACENYGDENMSIISKNVILDSMNKGMIQEIKKCADRVKISFLTTPRCICI